MQDINDWQSKFVSCIYSDKLMNKLLKINGELDNKIDLVEVQKAIYYARKYHGTQIRKSGEPYYSHPIEVAVITSDYIPKTDIIITALLHDTIEDTELTKEMIAGLFGKRVANQVEDLTRIKFNKKITAAETVIALFAQHKKDMLHVKLFDRLHNVKTISAMKPEKIDRIARETLCYFIPLAIYLKLDNIANELEQLCSVALLNVSSIYSPFVEDNSLIISLKLQND